jgi:NAD(P)-dependent dehydrogenase (short-subunit alcohol dehydrogenase family)
VELQGVGAIVTGGASGLGEATVRRLAAAGANVAIADLNEERGKAIAAELGAGVEFLRTDVTSAEDVEELVQLASSRLPLRVAVNCAGKLGAVGRIVTRNGQPHSLEGFADTIQSFLVGTFNVMRLAAVQMAKEEPLDDGERGVVIMTSSIMATDGPVGQAAYAAAKGGIDGLTLPAARDLAAIGVRVVTIAPGMFMTPVFDGMPDAGLQHLASLPPFPTRMGRPDEFAALVEHVCANVMLNGEVIRLDGATRFPPK